MTEKEVIKVPIVAGTVIKKDGKYLLIQEKRPNDPRVHELWNFPAGRVDAGDTIEQTAIKEAKEECGFDVELVRKLDIWQDSEKEPPQHAFEARIVGGELAFPRDEILDARWFSFGEVENMADKLRGGWVLGAIRMLEAN